jgi:mannose-6-phosphate isomerase-like protein (cupin superfamily)
VVNLVKQVIKTSMACLFISMSVQKKRFESPDETRSFDKSRVELVKLGDNLVGRATLEPGWSWEKCVKPTVKTDSCQLAHTQYIVSGHLKIIMDDGTEVQFGPGETGYVPPGHNSIVVGNEPVIMVDFTGLKDLPKV